MARTSKLRQSIEENPTLLGAVEHTNEQKLHALLQAWREGLTPPERLDLDDWSDRYRVLPSETSSEPGRWRTSRFPFLRRIMKCLSPTSRSRVIAVMKGAQLGFTEICINWILYNSDQNPGPTMYVQRTEDAAQDFSTQKLDPNIRICTRVATKIGPKKPKFLTDDWANKGFPGGFVVLGGSNSGAFLRSKSIRDAMADEEDSFKGNIDSEGSPISMIGKRMVNFPNGKFFRLSTPKFRETSTIEPAYDSGTQEQFYVPCPLCNPHGHETGNRFVIRWVTIRYTEECDAYDEPTRIWCECPHCGGEIEEHKKTWMMETAGNFAAYGWMSEKNSPGKPYPITDDVERPSFQISSLYSPLGFFSWRDAVREWKEYRKTNDKALMQVFINQTLGETYSAAGQDVSATWLEGRKEMYPIDCLPPGVLVITAGADVQEDRIELEIVGHGLNGETYSLGYHIFYGDTDTVRKDDSEDANPTAWQLLDETLRQTWKHPSGVMLGIECTLVDTGFRAEPVHVFCRLWETHRVYPVRGRAGWGKGYIERPKRRNEKFKTWDFVVWTDECKDQIYENLRVEKPGPGYCHFPMKDEYSSKYFGGLTAENKKTKKSGGKTVLYWDCPAGVRNEPLDVRVYAFGALKVYQPNLEYRASTMMVGKTGGAGSEAQPAARVEKKPIGHAAFKRGTPRPGGRRGSPGL